MNRWALVRIGLVAAVALVVGLLGTRVYRLSVIVGDSMAPTLRAWDLVLSRRTSAYQPQRGDIISFRTADDPPLYFVKRVVGLPGETVSIEDGIIYINGQPLPEPYTTPNANWQLPATLVPSGQVFVVGDNRQADLDAHLHGLVATRLVVARLVWHWRWKRS